MDTSDMKKAAAEGREKLTSANVAKNISLLEAEWAKYKYLILGRNPNGYKAIRLLLKDKSAYPADEFFAIVDESLAMPENYGWEINAAQHVFGYFKSKATADEKAEILGFIERYGASSALLTELKGALYRLSVKYEVGFLTQSYYFWDE